MTELAVEIEESGESEDVAVVCNVIDAWETWSVRVPVGASDEWIEENLPLLEKWLLDSGGTAYVVDEISRA